MTNRHKMHSAEKSFLFLRHGYDIEQNTMHTSNILFLFNIHKTSSLNYVSDQIFNVFYTSDIQRIVAHHNTLLTYYIIKRIQFDLQRQAKEMAWLSVTIKPVPFLKQKPVSSTMDQDDIKNSHSKSIVRCTIL